MHITCINYTAVAAVCCWMYWRQKVLPAGLYEHLVFCEAWSGSSGFNSDKDFCMFSSQIGTTFIDNVHPFSGCFVS